MKDYIIFGILLAIEDFPFVVSIIYPKYKKIIEPKKINIFYMLSAYLLMTFSWYLIKGNVLRGAIMGLVLYGVYAFTLLTILPGYTLELGLIEIIWGTLLFTTATFLTNKILKIINK